ncbi:hypothetical protein GCM10020358_20940 [Amorphoplanes nipponensis]|uniref:Uncharacterized protein n=1 Tax=Actinoplanes nipponensis TaxID=135950 RepID=A0A919JH94_9ACTN|nr:hypothetical protein [Actinoplanes nipponensis]GIE49345.1 hypothetical protein Ani05nite_28790 [Actinoplanes nipponensis]
MRKWFYAGAVAGGLLLLGAAPAHADGVPAPAGGLLGSLDGEPGSGLTSLVPANLLGGGLIGGGPTADGRTAPASARQESALFDGGVPLLGGLGGLLPANESPRTLPGAGYDTLSGLPAGGTPVDPTLVDPAPTDSAGAAAANQPVDDPRLHEEPIDDEAGGRKRTFSAGGRPIAGEDRDFR